MTNDEAKQLYNDAVAAMSANPTAALTMFDQLDAERPNSRQVTLNRGLCLVRLERLQEAQECVAKLKGKLEDVKLAELEAAIGAKRVLSAGTAGDTGTAAGRGSHMSGSDATPRTGAAPASNENVLVVESTFPVSTDEATVTGHMTSGVFHVGDMVTITSEAGMPLLAPIKRIGTADAPLKLVREGQRAVLLLEVEPHHIRPGGRIVSRSAEEAYAKTMVVGAASADQVPEELSPEILRVERDIKAGNFDSANGALDAYLATHPDSKTAHRLKAKLHLEAQDGMRDVKKALEHVRRAYELGGADDPAVIDTLAWAMGENGEGEHGLRFLERQSGQTTDPRVLAALAKRITDYRAKFGLGHVWEFSDAYGDVVFETKDLAEAARAIKSNTIPRNGKVRKDRVGEWRDIEGALATENPQIKAAYTTSAQPVNWVLVAGIALLVALGLAALMFI